MELVYSLVVKGVLDFPNVCLEVNIFLFDWNL